MSKKTMDCSIYLLQDNSFMVVGEYYDMGVISDEINRISWDTARKILPEIVLLTLKNKKLITYEEYNLKDKEFDAKIFHFSGTKSWRALQKSAKNISVSLDDKILLLGPSKRERDGSYSSDGERITVNLETEKDFFDKIVLAFDRST